MTDDMLCAALGSGLFAMLVGLNARYLGRRFGLLDFPDRAGGRKRHRHVTPLMGGAAVLVPVIAVLLAMSLGFGAIPAGLGRDMAVIGALTAVFYGVGLADDRLELSPRFRLIAGVIAFSLGMTMVPSLELQSLRFALSENPRGPMLDIPLPYISSVFTVVCMVGLLNAINMADGKNGLVIGLSLIWAAMMSLYAPAFLQGVLLVLAVTLAVALYFNLRGRFFLGDGGSYGLSALLGTLSIYIYNLPGSALTAGAIVVWFLVPVLDCLRLIIVRILKGRSPFSGDRDHLHHHLGFLMGWPNGLLVYWLMVGIPSVVVFLFPDALLQTLAASGVVYATVVGTAYRRQAVNAG